MALFELDTAHDSAKAALRAAADIGAALEDFNKTLIGEGAPEVRIGIGLHLGDIVLGEIGAVGNAPRTIIGDTVNAASRLEAETKRLGVELLVSESVLEAAALDPNRQDLLELELRGVSDPVFAAALTKAMDAKALLI